MDFLSAITPQIAVLGLGVLVMAVVLTSDSYPEMGGVCLAARLRRVFIAVKATMELANVSGTELTDGG
jgi:hypothetical protein